MSEHKRPTPSGLGWAGGCLGDIFWEVVLVCAGAFVVIVLFEPGPLVVSSWTKFLVLAVIALAVLVVLTTTTFGYLRAKRAATKPETRDSDSSP